MKGKLIICLVIIVLLAVVASIFIIKNNSNVENNSLDNSPSVEEGTNTNPSSTVSPIEEKVNDLMDTMTIDQKIAQMLVLYYTKDTVDTTFQNFLQTTPPGGIILMKENITTYEKTKKFTDDLKKYSNIPLIISIDQEGGNVQRLKYLSNVAVTNIPSMYELGKTNDTSLAYDVGRIIAEELRTIGVNVVYAPVVDVYFNPNNTVIGKRSFGHSPDLVSNMAISVARGLEDNKVIATYKHFPGHRRYFC